MNKKIIIMILCAVFLLTACDNNKNTELTQEEILKTAIEENKKLEEYYGKWIVETHKSGILAGKSITKEWSKKVEGNINRKTEIDAEKIGKRTSLIQDNMLQIYVEDENVLYNYGNIEGIEPDLDQSIIDKTVNTLEVIKDMKVIKDMGYQELDDRSIYRIKGSEKDNAPGEAYYFVEIDKESFIVKRMIIESEDMRASIKNEEIDIISKVDLDKFKLNLPDDVKVINK